MVPSSRSEIQFWYQGALVSLAGQSPQKTVLRWLRDDRRALGTKEGCGEGDCGACTVVVGTLDAGAPQGLALKAVNSCLMLLPSLDGKALFTVEDVASGPDLHPVQRALVELHGSQCGFCTPGFVMSLWADYEGRTGPPSQEETEVTLSGNLCRCTGYRPILDAARTAWDTPTVKFDRRPVTRVLEQIAVAPPLEYAHGGQSWSAPQTLATLATLTENRPSARLVAGSTDLGLWVTKGLKNLGDLISTTAVAELRVIRDEGGALEIGAAVPLTEAFEVLTARHPELREFGRRFASTPVRNAGTLGGNVANGSPIGDSLPLLLALEASLVLHKGLKTRTVALEDYYLGYQKSVREPGELLSTILIPSLAPGTFLRAWKVTKRRDQDISAVCAAFCVTVGARGTVTSARAAFGGMAATPLRARKTEAALVGRPFDEASLNDARRVLATEFTPLTDGRATAEYRTQVASNLLTRFHNEWTSTGSDR